MIREISSGEYEVQLEEALQEILLNSSDSLKLMLKFFTLIDTAKLDLEEIQDSYCIGNRKLHIINTSQELEEAIKLMNTSPFIGFDSEQKPTFTKGQKSNGISLIQLANDTDCYIIQNKQIKNLTPLLNILEDKRIIKVGTGLGGDKDELFNQFNIKLMATIDVEETLKRLSSKNAIGAKRAAAMFLNKNLLKSKRMSRSNWENKELSSDQIKYASEDATVVYDTMIQILQDYPFVLKSMPRFFQKSFKS